METSPSRAMTAPLLPLLALLPLLPLAPPLVAPPLVGPLPPLVARFPRRVALRCSRSVLAPCSWPVVFWLAGSFAKQ